MKRAKSPESAAGVSLLESLIALLILSIGLLGLAGLHTQSMQYNYDAYHRTQATNLAYDISERMRANRLEAMDGAYNVETDDTPDKADVVDGDLIQWWDQTNRLLPDPAIQIDIGRNGKGSIRITWGRNSGERATFELDVRL